MDKIASSRAPVGAKNMSLKSGKKSALSCKKIRVYGMVESGLFTFFPG